MTKYLSFIEETTISELNGKLMGKRDYKIIPFNLKSRNY